MISLEAFLEIALIVIILILSILGGKKMTAAFDNLATQVATSIAEEQAATALINGIPQKVADAIQADAAKMAELTQQVADLTTQLQAANTAQANDDAAKEQLTAQLKTTSDALQAAIAAQQKV